MDIQHTIQNIATPIAEDMNLTIVGVRINTEKGTTVQVLLENKDGTPPTLDACEKLSRELGYTLDVEDAIQQAFTLEVSSPGMNRPLFSLNDVIRFKGKNAKVRLQEELDGKRAHTGKLGDVEGDSFTLHTDEGDVVIAWLDIKDAKLAPTQDEIKELLKQKSA